jgi:hypothetical protein
MWQKGSKLAIATHVRCNPYGDYSSFTQSPDVNIVAWTDVYRPLGFGEGDTLIAVAEGALVTVDSIDSRP